MPREALNLSLLGCSAPDRTGQDSVTQTGEALCPGGVQANPFPEETGTDGKAKLPPRDLSDSSILSPC